MKKLVYTLSGVLAMMCAFTACDNGNADFEIIDVAPSITFGEVGAFFDNAANSISITVKDGNEGFSQSTISSVTYVVNEVVDENTENEVTSGSVTATGTLATTTIDFAAGSLPPADYKVIVTAVDSNGNSDSAEVTFSMFAGFSTIGIIGDATPGGWGEDTDMTPVGDGVYEITIALQALSAKFRADDAWDVAWGSTDFPSGTGDVTGGSPNIPIPEAATYKVTFDTKDASYNFEKQ